MGKEGYIRIPKHKTGKPLNIPCDKFVEAPHMEIYCGKMHSRSNSPGKRRHWNNNCLKTWGSQRRPEEKRNKPVKILATMNRAPTFGIRTEDTSAHDTPPEVSSMNMPKRQ